MATLRRVLGTATHLPAPLFGGVLRGGSYPRARTQLRSDAVSLARRRRPRNKVLVSQAPIVDPAETTLPRPHRSALSQLRSGYCSQLKNYHARVGWAPTDLCQSYRSTPNTVEHLFNRQEYPSDLSTGDLWTRQSPSSSPSLHSRISPTHSSPECLLRPQGPLQNPLHHQILTLPLPFSPNLTSLHAPLVANQQQQPPIKV